MAQQSYDYIIVGAGLTGASAVEGIRERDARGTILLVGAEPQRPYNRPPLSKQLWTGKETLETIFVHKAEFYEQQRVTLLLNTEVTTLDASAKAIAGRNGQRYQYGKLLLATSGHPRTLSIPGGDLDGISYFRTYESYVRLRRAADTGKSAVVIGGGFIGSELAAALTIIGCNVTMIFPEPYLVNRVFPEPLGRAIQNNYVDRGVRVLDGDRPVSIARTGERFTCPHSKRGSDRRRRRGRRHWDRAGSQARDAGRTADRKRHRGKRATADLRPEHLRSRRQRLLPLQGAWEVDAGRALGQRDQSGQVRRAQHGGRRCPLRLHAILLLGPVRLRLRGGRRGRRVARDLMPTGRRNSAPASSTTWRTVW